jgi:hypothetical protein
MATNNNAHSLDTAGNPQVDFVWGNQPLQPNDVRTETAASNIGGSTGDVYWAATTQVTGARLDFAGTSAYSGSGAIANVIVKSANHELEETGYASYPSYTPDAGNYIVTAASGDGTTVTYTSFNFLNPGDSVNITGLTTSAFNLSSATVASATRQSFTVTNSATGTAVTGAYGKVQATNAVTGFDGAYVSGVAYIDVPSVLGLTTASAVDSLKDAGFATASITTASGAANSAATITAVSRTGSTATITSSGAGAAYPVGTKITVASLVSPNTDLNGTWTVTSSATNTLTFTTTTSGALSTTGLSVAGLTGTTGTIKTQSVAAGAASIALSAAVTVTPWA